MTCLNNQKECLQKFYEKALHGQNIMHFSESLKINWIVLISYKESDGEDKKIGITASGNWIVEVGPKTELLDRPSSFLFCLTVLEQPLSFTLEYLGKTFGGLLSSMNLTAKVIFPFVQIIRYSLRSGQNYWMNLGLEWYKYLEISEEKLLEEELKYIVNEKKGSQRVRHQAQKELVKFKKKILEI